MKSAPMLPTFLGIGPGRSASTLIFEALRAHPDVCFAAGTKETNYFSFEYARGLEWYTSYYEHCVAGNARGEISNTYVYDPDAPRRIVEVVPDVRLFTVLRNPFERLRSAYRHRKSVGELPSQMGLAEALTEYPNLITQNHYADQLSRFLEYFPREQVKILFYDDLVEAPVAFYQELLRFIGVRTDFVPAVLHERVNRSRRPRFGFVAPAVRVSADTLRRLGFLRTLAAARGSWVLRGLLYGADASDDDDLAESVREHLVAQFEPQIRRVEVLTGRDLSAWLPSRGIG